MTSSRSPHGPRETLQHVWDLCLALPEPMGFDLAPIYGTVAEPGAGQPAFGVLRLTPSRIAMARWPEPLVMWTPE